MWCWHYCIRHQLQEFCVAQVKGCGHSRVDVYRLVNCSHSSTSCTMLKMMPDSVCKPVAMTTLEPQPAHGWDLVSIKRSEGEWHIPFHTNVPIYATHTLSASSMPLGQGTTPFLRSVVLPVRLLLSMSRSRAVNKRTSAGMRSPAVKVTRLCGTSSLASR
jgi:hypothetical protein